MNCFKNSKGMFAVAVHRSERSIMIAKFEIGFAIEKFGNYSITSVNRGEDIVIHTNLPYVVYNRLKNSFKRKNHLTN